jgi:hypothetical protein
MRGGCLWIALQAEAGQYGGESQFQSGYADVVASTGMGARSLFVAGLHEIELLHLVSARQPAGLQGDSRSKWACSLHVVIGCAGRCSLVVVCQAGRELDGERPIVRAELASEVPRWLVTTRCTFFFGVVC